MDGPVRMVRQHRRHHRQNELQWVCHMWCGQLLDVRGEPRSSTVFSPSIPPGVLLTGSASPRGEHVRPDHRHTPTSGDLSGGRANPWTLTASVDPGLVCHCRGGLTLGLATSESSQPEAGYDDTDAADDENERGRNVQPAGFDCRRDSGETCRAARRETQRDGYTGCCSRNRIAHGLDPLVCGDAGFGAAVGPQTAWGCDRSHYHRGPQYIPAPVNLVYEAGDSEAVGHAHRTPDQTGDDHRHDLRTVLWSVVSASVRRAGDQTPQ